MIPPLELKFHDIAITIAFQDAATQPDLDAVAPRESERRCKTCQIDIARTIDREARRTLGTVTTDVGRKNGRAAIRNEISLRRYPYLRETVLDGILEREVRRIRIPATMKLPSESSTTRTASSVPLPPR
jgi:hypothetical protein